MSHKIDKQKAYELVTPVADGEATKEEKDAFFSYIKDHPDVQRYYEEEIWLKKLIKDKISGKQAPVQFKKKMHRLVASLSVEESRANALQHANHAGRDVGLKKLTMYGIAAAIILSAFLYLTLAVTDSSFSEFFPEERPSLEAYVHHQFIQHKGELLQPDIFSTSKEEVETLIHENFNLNVAIPRIADATFSGVINADVISGYNAPLLAYRLEENDNLYIFAFDIPTIEARMKRDQGAVDHCNNISDYYITTIDDLDLVSWRRDDTWYTAISLYEGEDLAGILAFR